MTALFVALPGNAALARRLAELLGGTAVELESRNFPDGETYLRFTTEVTARDVVLVCTLDQPDAKIPALLFAADTARQLGAARIGLVAPYLCYMRQDKRFKPGEAVTSRSFAALLSRYIDWLVTIDPHLHRYRSLDEIYTIPAAALRAGPLIGAWISRNVEKPFLVGPDSESRQWVETVAAACGAPWTVMDKTRSGDRAVEEKISSFPLLAGRTAVLLDDIVSSGSTLLEAARILALSKPVQAIAIHALCDDETERALASAGIRLAATNTTAASTGVIDVTPLLAEGIAALLRPARG